MKLLSLSEFITEKYKPLEYGILLEGGAAGHMAHPFDDHNLRFKDLKRIVDSALEGKLDFDQQPTEKTDGQNIFISYMNGGVVFARNKGQLINPLDLKGILTMFKGHASRQVEDTFTLAAKDLDKAISKLRDKSMFNNGKSFMNIEIIYSGNVNVINYDKDVIQFHNMVHTDGKGKIIDSDTKLASSLSKALKDVKANVQDTFTIIPPQILKLAKSVDFETREKYYFKKIDKLRDKYNLKDNDEVILYHENWWKEEIENTFSDLPPEAKRGLLLRWAYDDKQTLNMRAISKLVDSSQAKEIKAYDKMIKTKMKENILPFENLFLELGADVLKNASNFVATNPEKEKQRLHSDFKKEAAKIKKNGDLSQIEKVERELKRLESIGGIESVIPSEGIVFKYKGKTYKLTGTFAPFNQLMGIMKYTR